MEALVAEHSDPDDDEAAVLAPNRSRAAVAPVQRLALPGPPRDRRRSTPPSDSKATWIGSSAWPTLLEAGKIAQARDTAAELWELDKVFSHRGTIAGSPG